MKNGYTLDQFKIDMDNVLAWPELINCQNYNKSTVAEKAATSASIETAKWAVSKGIDLTITNKNGRTAYDVVLHLIKEFTENKKGVYPPTPENLARLARWNRLTTILSPAPRPATKSCAEVDGQTPPANEYCIVAENMQESFASRLINPIFDGYQHITTAKASGIGFFKDWRSTITFYCRASPEEICGPLDYTVDDNWPEEVAQEIKDTYGLYIRCGDSINLLDVDAFNAGGGVKIDMHQPVDSPYSHNCKAHSSNPFTLTIKTIRLAQ